MKNTSPLITLSLLSLLSCAVLANGTYKTVSATKGGIAVVIDGDNNKVDLSPTALKQLTKESKKILALLTALNAKQHPPSERENHLAQENQQLKAQMKQLAQQLALSTVNPNPAARKAVQGLGHGDLKPTADYLRAIAQKSQNTGMKKNPKAAQAMRQLASISTTTEALNALQRACDYEPDNTLNWWLLGNMHLHAGNVARAEQAYRTMLRLTQTATHSHPKDLDAQRNLSVSYNKIGEIQQAQGDVSGALASYRAYHAIAQTLAQKDKGNVQGQTDLVASYWKLANVSQGNESKGFLRQGLAILEQLARKNQLNADQKNRWLPLFRNALAQ